MDPFEDVNPKIAKLREKAAVLPLQPGVYLMKNAEKKIIYVGKAKILKNRVNQYFHTFGNLTPKTVKLVGQIDDFDYIVASSEYEALLLECNLIKQYKPHYNILLKDDKGMSYIRITPAPWARIEACHRPENDGGEYIGPFPSSYTVKLMVEQTREIFGLPTCNRTFGGREDAQRPCLNYFIKKCYGPCKFANADPVRHAERIAEARDFLRDGDRATIAALTSQMETASENLDFERAAALRDRIRAIEAMAGRQTVVSVPVGEADAFACAMNTEAACFAVISIRNHRLTNKQHYPISDTAVQPEQESALYADFLLGYYADRTEIPPLILLDRPCDDPELLEQLLTEKRGKRVHIGVPQRGDNKQLTDMAAANAAEQLVVSIGSKRETGMLSELSRLCGLDEPAHYIESYDVSHTSGADNVCGMIVYADGKPKRSHYRQFLIRDFEGADDCGSLREAVRRRYLRYENPENRDEAFGTKPDLILVDGGQAQANAVRSALAALQITDIPVLGMVKDSHHRTRGLIDPDGAEIDVRSARAAFALLTAIQDEVHRYVITCHRRRRSRRTVTSVLSNIPGIGPKRIAALMDHFGSIEAIAAASEDDLAAVEGMSRSAAERTRRFFTEEY